MPHLLVVGLSHKTAPVEQREKAALTPTRTRSLLREMVRHPLLTEVAALSTCNRTEVYVRAQDPGLAEEEACRTLVEHTKIGRDELDCVRYVHLDERAAAHLFRVASSLDSMVVGESEIQSQVRAAWDLAMEEGAAGPLLDRLFRQALEAGKRVRRETRVSTGPVSVSTVAVDLVADVLGDLGGRRALLVGAGRMAEATGRALVERGVRDLMVVNRTVGTARDLAVRLQARGAGFDRLGGELGAADIVVSSTDAPHPILTRSHIEWALAERRDRPMVLVDIAVPRDLDPGIADLPGAVLYDIDDLEAVVEANRDGRRVEARRGEAVVAEEVRRFIEWRHGLAAAPIISSLRSMAEAIRQGELTRHGAQLDALSREDRERVEALTRSIVNKLLHEPTVRVRQAAQSGDGLRHMESLQHLFGLEVPDRLTGPARAAGAQAPAHDAADAPSSDPLRRAS